MKKVLPIFIVLLSLLTSVSAQVSLTAPNVAYTQDFNTLASTGTAAFTTFPSGWLGLETGGSANTIYTAGTGSSTTGDTYSFGAASATDRALGGLQSGSVAPNIGAAFTNNTGKVIKELLISYKGEQWRIGAIGRTDKLIFSYSTNATTLATGTFTNETALDFTAPVTTGTIGALDGNLAANSATVTSSITGLNIAIGATFIIKWADSNPAGSDDGLGIDNFSITPITCDVTGLSITGLACTGANATFNANFTITNGTGTFNVVDGNNVVVGSGTSSPIACSFPNSNVVSTTTIKVVSATDPACTSMTTPITYPNCLVCAITASASPAVCSGTNATYNVTFSATNGSGSYQIKDITNNVVLATVASSPATITIPNSIAASYNIQVIDAGNVTCTSASIPVSIPACNVFSGTATSTLVGSSVQGQYNIILDGIMGVPVGSTITAGGVSVIYTGVSPLTLGPLTFNTSGLNNVVVTFTSPTSTLIGTLQTTQVFNPANGISQNSTFCNCIVSSVAGVPGGIMAQAKAGTYNALYNQYYVLVQANNIVTANTTGFFTGLANGAYQVYALNIEPTSLATLTAALTAGTPIANLLTPTGALATACFTVSAPAPFNVNCVSNINTTPQNIAICSAPGATTASAILTSFEAGLGVTGVTWTLAGTPVASTTVTVTSTPVTYQFTVLDNNNCSKTGSLTLSLTLVPAVGPTAANVTVCEGTPTTITPVGSATTGTPTVSTGTATATYNFNASSAIGVSSNPALTVTPMVRSNSIVPGYVTGCGTAAVDLAFTSSNWPNAPNALDFYEFSATSTGSNILKVNNIQVKARRSNTGPFNLEMYIDGVKYGTTQIVAAACTPLTFTGNASIFACKTSKIQFRASGAGGTTGTFRIDDVILTTDILPSTSGNTLFNFYASNPATAGASLLASNAATFAPVVAAGTMKDFWVTEYNGKCESPATKVTVKVNVSPTAQAASTDAVCPTGATASITLFLVTGVPTLTYAWTGAGVVQGQDFQLNLVPGTYTYTVTDGNMPACSTSGSVVLSGGMDTEAPVLVGTPLVAITAECDAIPAVAAVTATDNCTSPITPIFISGSNQTSSGACTDNSYTITRSWFATDDAGNSSQFTQTITVQDTKAPTFVAASIPANVTIACSAPLPTAVPTAIDNCDIDVAVSVVTTSTRGTNPALCDNYTYIVTRTFTAVDNCGNTASTQQTITVRDAIAPTITLATGIVKTLITPNVTLALADVISSIGDNCATYSLIVAPTTFNCSKIGNNTVTVTATDVCGNVQSATTTVTILDGPGCNAGSSAAIVDPCVCKNNATTLQNGQFDEKVTITGFKKQNYRIKTVAGLYKPTAPINPVAADLVAVASALAVQTPDSTKYDLKGLHIDSIGYNVTVERVDALGAVIVGSELTVSDKCYYPTPILTVPGECVLLDNTTYTLASVDKNGGSGTATFKVDGVAATTYNPLALGAGDHTVEISFDAGTAASNLLTDPGCIQKVTKIVKVISPTLACSDHVNISLGTSCEVNVSSENFLTSGTLCSGGYTTIVMLNGVVIPPPFKAENIGIKYTYKVLNAGTGNSCWGTVNFEDKTAPILTCNPETVTCDADIKYSADVANASSLQQLGAIKAPKVEDCTLQSMTYFDQEENFMCANATALEYVSKRVLRTWKATDKSGNISTCAQLITFVRPNLSAFALVAATKNYECNETYPQDANGNPTKENAGLPVFKLGLTVIKPEMVCNLMQVYADTTLVGCGNGKKILRTWTILDWCSNKTFVTKQMIVIEDRIKPSFVNTLTKETITVGSGLNCKVEAATLPFPAATDNCDLSLDKTFRIVDATGNTVANGAAVGNTITFGNIGIGDYFVQYTVTDDCGNSTSATQSISVKDLIAPVAVCNSNLKVSLTLGGVGEVAAVSINEGSYDNCCLDASRFEIKRQSESDLLFKPKMSLNCLDTNVMVVMRVWDCNQISNTCMVNVKVDMKLKPIIFAKDTSMVCSNNAEAAAWLNANTPQEKSLLSYPSASNPGWYSSCPGSKLTKTDSPKINNCGTGTLVRTWTITSPNGQKATATQTVTTINLSAYEVTFPDDVVFQCDNGSVTPTSDPKITGEPKVVYNGKSCPLVGVEYEDINFDIVPGSCYKTLRKWKILNWCQLSSSSAINNGLDADRGKECSTKRYSNIDPQTVAISKLTNVSNPLFRFKAAAQAIVASTCGGYDDDGYMEYTQIIKVDDTTPPIITKLNPVIVTPKGKDCEVTVTVNAPEATDYCAKSVNSYVSINKIEAGNKETLIEEFYFSNTVLSKSWDFNLASLKVNVKGDYVARFKVSDKCGNFITSDVAFVVKDEKKPTPVCHNALSASLMANGMVMIPATYFDAGSYDNCTATNKLKYRVQGILATATTPFDFASAQDMWTFKCPPPGTMINPLNPFAQLFKVALWVGDEAGNWDYCETSINIQDNMQVCGYVGIQMKPVFGVVANDKGEPIEGAKVTLDGMKGSTVTTGKDGKYAFMDMPLGNDYTLSIEKNDNPLNGVSTYDLVQMSKHILNTQSFKNAFKLVAADVNKSNSITTYDMVELRKLILHINTDFTNNKSWRFVDSKYQFPTQNPLTSALPETIKFTLGAASSEYNFVGIKIGDINGNSSPNSTIPVSDREGKSTFSIETKEEVLELGKTFTTELHASDLKTLEGGQFTLTYDANLLELEEVVADKENYSVLENGKILFSWSKALENSLVSLRFRSKTNDVLSNVLKLNSSVLKAEAYGFDDEYRSLALVFNGAIAAPTNFELFQNVPNPTNAATTIGFTLPNDELAKITFSDATGRILKVLEQKYTKGYNEIQLQRGDLDAKGVVYYRLETSTNVGVKKMVIIK